MEAGLNYLCKAKRSRLVRQNPVGLEAKRSSKHVFRESNSTFSCGRPSGFPDSSAMVGIRNRRLLPVNAEGILYGRMSMSVTPVRATAISQECRRKTSVSRCKMLVAQMLAALSTGLRVLSQLLRRQFFSQRRRMVFFGIQ